MSADLDKYWLVLFAVLAGGLVATQGGINAQLGKALQQPVLAGLISFSVGTLLLAVIVVATSAQLPTIKHLASQPIYLYIGGLFGAVFVTTNIVLIPKIGVANMVLGAFVGQIILSLIIDHFGWFGVPQHSIDVKRLCGALLMVLGLVLITR
ncbi:glycyl-tRNA synthetase, beta subunit [gamma proteobacterium HTCC5015]|nr:glycyl-tRNA synthetase, beta subunit [gamma proteobacterium HTCC5015]